MVRPKWIAALVFALAVAAGFAALGQWQFERAVQSGTAVEHPTERTIPLDAAARPGGPIKSAMVGQLVTVTGTLEPRDFVVLAGRQNNGSTGYWVTGRLTVETGNGPAGLAVALGWAKDRSTADTAVRTLRSRPEQPLQGTGRLLPTEAPIAPAEHGPAGPMTAMSVAALVNVWPGIGDLQVYEAYVVMHGTPPVGLDAIYSPPPIEQQTINWLNVFYAAEWAVFAGFAVFLWYRVVRDSWERECEELLESGDEDAPGAGPVAGTEDAPSDGTVS